jgi:hypothetical protein
VVPGGFQRIQGLDESGGVADAEEHPADVGLVRDPGIEQLDRHRPGQRGKGRVRLLPAGAHPARRGGDAQRAEDRLGLILVERPGRQVDRDARFAVRSRRVGRGLAARVFHQGPDGRGQAAGTGQRRHWSGTAGAATSSPARRRGWRPAASLSEPGSHESMFTWPAGLADTLIHIATAP